MFCVIQLTILNHGDCHFETFIIRMEMQILEKSKVKILLLFRIVAPNCLHLWNDGAYTCAHNTCIGITHVFLVSIPKP